MVCISFDFIDLCELSTISLEIIISAGIGLFAAFLLLKQMRKQTKVDSARFTIDYVEDILKKNKGIINDLRKKHVENQDITYDARVVRVFLNHLENLTLFTKQGLIRKDHMLNELEFVLKQVKKDQQFNEIISTEQKKDKKLFVEIKQFLDDL